MKTVKIKCNDCNTEFKFDITDEQYRQYTNKEGLIQNIFPNMAPEYRELFISGICPYCWNKLFNYEK